MIVYVITRTLISVLHFDLHTVSLCMRSFASLGLRVVKSGRMLQTQSKTKIFPGTSDGSGYGGAKLSGSLLIRNVGSN